jgi:broad specificity phosphatase PhoE
MGKPRGKQIPAAKWWVDEAIALIAKHKGGLAEAGKALARAGERKTAYSKTTMSRIVSGDMKITVELADAVCRLYDMPSPVFFPRSREEALDLARTAARYSHLDPELDKAHEKRVEEIQRQPTPPENLETMEAVHARLADQAKKAVKSRSRHRHRKTRR